MYQYFIGWLNDFELPYSSLIALVAILVVILIISLIAHAILHRAVLPFLRRLSEKSSRQWPKSLIDNKLFSRFALVMQGILLQIQLDLFLTGIEPVYTVLLVASQIWLMVFSLLMFFSLLDVALDL